VTREPDEFRRRAVRAALIVAAIAVGIGLVIGGLTATVVYVSGVLPQGKGPPTIVDGGKKDENSLPTPSLSPTDSPSAAPTPSASETTGTTESTTPSPTASATAKPSRSPKPNRSEPILLRASTSRAASYENVTLSGRYLGANGTTLQVQRREGGAWAQFPTSATVDGGTFSTFVASGQPGRNEFRVVDPGTGRTSNVVAFTVS
jgi:hypothetical protein